VPQVVRFGGEVALRERLDQVLPGILLRVQVLAARLGVGYRAPGDEFDPIRVPAFVGGAQEADWLVVRISRLSQRA
jgi:hypothetical protein